MSDPAPPIRVRSFAKVNLALAVVAKRADGYHEIRTVLQTIDLADRLELRQAPGLTLEVRGDADLAALPPEQNLVWRAAAALRRAAAVDAGAAIVLDKRIPAGAGLGGGSSNAAAALLGLARLWSLEPEPALLRDLAATLGSDVPFFLQGGTALGVGRGEEVYPLPEAAPRHLVVIYPGVAVSTRDAYASLGSLLTSPSRIPNMLSFCSQLAGDSGSLAGIFNDFEASILTAHAPVREAKSFLERAGAVAALMSGSGSSVFGFFESEESALAASRAAARGPWRAFPAKTLTRAEYLRQLLE